MDSQASSRSAIEAAMELSHRLDCAVCVTGETDYVVEKNKTVAILNGHPIMAKVTGVAGELAAETASGPGSFQALYLDALYNLNAEQIAERQKIR